MSDPKTILVIGTYDTKSDELGYLTGCIKAQGGRVLAMDVSVLDDSPLDLAIDKHAVAAAAGTTIEAVSALGDENEAMQAMSAGAAAIVALRHREGAFDAMIALGGTMGTDLALDCARALPMGVPKYVVSTVAFSPLIPAERLAPDIQMILWAGGLYGLNSVCRSSLSQAAGAVLGAARAVEAPPTDRPLIGMTSLGKSCLKYMVTLKPALEERGFEVAIFHATGMGGRAFESLAAEGAFAAVMDFSLQELANVLNGSIVSAGKDRLLGAGRAGTPQIVAPGATDLIDLPTWQERPARFNDRPYHAHNRLIASVTMTPGERRQAARAIGERLARARGPAHVILPSQGIEEWDREGQEAHDPEGFGAFLDEMRGAIQAPVGFTEVDCHINDPLFCETALTILDDWLERGVVQR